MESTWPSADLMLAGVGAGAGKKVARHVRKRLGGNRYISAIFRDAARLDHDVRVAILECLTRSS